jgi:hypothetical protein
MNVYTQNGAYQASQFVAWRTCSPLRRTIASTFCHGFVEALSWSKEANPVVETDLEVVCHR